MFALATTAIAWVIFAAVALFWVVYYFANRNSARPELGAEIELAPNRKPYYDDEVLEGSRLERVQLLGVLLLVVLVIGLPLYWIFEPDRMAGATDQKEASFIAYGAELFATTAEGGFNCAGCHGANGGGGSAPYTLTDANTDEVQAVTWIAPALNTVLYRFSESEVKFILTYGRPFSPMSPWGLDGGGPMNDQQLDTLISYIRSIQIPRIGCAANETDPRTCASGFLPDDDQQRITEAAEAAAAKLVESGKYATVDEAMGEALFNLDINGGAYSCARCHTPGWSYGKPGVAGQGAFGWNMTGGALAKHFPDEQAQIDFVTAGSENGRKYGIQGQGSGRMPAFGNLLTDEQIKAIVEYTRSL
jgi:mono/diheme cytochrome c family protein